MKAKPKNKVVPRTVLASTASGFVSGVLAANGTAQQLPDPNSTTNATSVVGDSGTAVTQTGGTAVAGDAGMAKNERYGVAIAGTA